MVSCGHGTCDEPANHVMVVTYHHGGPKAFLRCQQHAVTDPALTMAANVAAVGVLVAKIRTGK